MVIEHFARQGYELWFHRKKIARVEIDLLMKKGNQFLGIEVKSVRTGYEDYYRVTRKQIQRLYRVFDVLSRTTEKKFDVCIAFVNLDEGTVDLRELEEFL